MIRIWNYFTLRNKQLSHDVQGLVFAFFLPILSLVVVGYLAQQNTPSITVNYRLDSAAEAMPDLDGALARISQTEGIVFRKTDGDPAAMEKQIRENKLSFYVVFTTSEASPQATLFYNKKDTNNAVLSLAIERILTGSIAGLDFRKSLVSDLGKSYLDIFLPGMLAFTIAVLGLSGFGGYILQDRQRGVFKKLKTVDVKPYNYLLGILLSRIGTILVLFLIYLALGYFAFHYEVRGSLVLAFLLVLLLSLVLLSFGLIVATVTKTVESYSGLANLLQIGLVLGGGAFFSLDGLPDYVRAVLAYSPLWAFTSGFQLCATNLNSVDLGAVMMDLGILAAWTLVLFPLSLRRFKW